MKDEILDAASLREMLLASERRRAQAESSRHQVEVILSGLDMLASATNIDDLFNGILGIIHELVPYEAAAVLVEEHGRLTVAASTDERLPIASLAIGRFLGRVLDGRPAVVTDLRLVPSLEPLVADGSPLRSGVFMPLPAKDGERALFTCLGHTVGQYASEHRDVLHHVAPLSGQALQRYRDVRRVEELLGQLDRQAHTDALTGLANRARFNGELGRCIERFRSHGEPFALLSLDADNLKAVNDTLGHSAGDALIQAIACTLDQTTRLPVLCARLGGDEFAVLIPDATDIDAVDLIAGRLLRAITSTPLQIHANRIVPSVSIGMVCLARDGVPPEDAHACADLALYEAKEEGGGRIVPFASRMHATWMAQRRTEVELRTAIAEDQLACVYQPIVELEGNRIVGFEAFVRWHHPERGLLLPDRFLPAAKRGGLMPDVDTWVLRRAATEVAPWLAANGDRRLAVNMAQARPLPDDVFANHLIAFDRHGVDVGQLELELGEHAAQSWELKVTGRAVDALRTLGVGLAFDGFGSGVWSIDRLRAFAGHRVKIDRRFVQRIATDGVDRAVVRGAIETAVAAGLVPVAVGVETREQLARLVELGCREAQGHLLGRPLPWSAHRTSTTVDG
ncbi:MAG: EAL domain-containing protein [Actinomycetota bacterium]